MTETTKNEREQERLRALSVYESRLYAAGAVAVAGVDEVGRGAVAGPVSAGACILGNVEESEYVHWLNDSKQLTPRRRTLVAAELRERAVAWSVAHVPPEYVDEWGIVPALRRAMREAVAGLAVSPDVVVVDGRPFELGLGAVMQTAPRLEFVVKGDSLVASIAAASVLAKVTRDELMVQLDERWPGYGFAGNKGYASAEHVESIGEKGLSPIHRKTFCQNFFQKKLF